MDPAVLSALSAVLGSAVGGTASIATAWFTQRSQGRRELIGNDIKKREALYGEFISECSRLAIDSLDHTLDTPELLVNVYALHNRIRLTASQPVVIAADQAIRHMLERYFGKPLTKPEIAKLALSMSEDPLRNFSEACRIELGKLQYWT